MEEELRGKRSWVTSHGWLLLWDPATLATFLWNPRAAAFGGSNNKIALQAWASPPEAGTGCALIRRSHGPRWLHGGGPRVVGRHGPVWYVPGLAACGGKFYCDVSSDEYGVLEFSPEPALTTMKMAKLVEIICYSKPFAYTLDLDGEVHTVSIFFSDTEAGAIIDVAVYRMDLAGKRSVRVESIGDRAILAGGSKCRFAGW
ncbi:hypothetical protein ACQ4PT_028961 [Festuca glaucescens]